MSDVDGHENLTAQSAKCEHQRVAVDKGTIVVTIVLLYLYMQDLLCRSSYFRIFASRCYHESSYFRIFYHVTLSVNEILDLRE